MENLINETVRRAKPVVHNDRVMWRALILLGAVLLAALIVMEYLRKVWRDDFELKTPGGNGAIVFHSTFEKGFRKVMFLVPASQCWVNTDLEFEPGETIRFRTSGQVHLAQNLIKQEELPKITWSRPGGSEFIRTVSAGDRSQFLLSQYTEPGKAGPQVGNVVGYLQAISIDTEPGPLNPRPVGRAGNRVFNIGADGRITNETGHKARLWLAVNDIVLDDSPAARRAYLGDSATFVGQEMAGFPVPTDVLRQLAVAKWQKHVATWDTLRVHRKWDLYYNDNIGTYLVFIEKE